jgi:hypothetical protein
MLLGPCGGVRADGGCEVVPDPCVFPVPVQWAGSPVPPVPLRAVPLILTDFSSEPYSVRMLTIVATTLAPSCDAVLVGEHQDRPDFPPALLASMLQEAGVRPWMTLACRNRNRIVLEEELFGLRHQGQPCSADAPAWNSTRTPYAACSTIPIRSRPVSPRRPARPARSWASPAWPA